jgi:cyclomaltodextrinase
MRLLALLGVCLAVGCARPEARGTADAVPGPGVPRWAQEAVWYQIFVERFRNGDSGNDPTPHDILGSWPHVQPEGWHTTPWGHDWYAQEPWELATGRDFYFTAQLRRYGGDLQGVLDELDGLRDLGVTALYLNPINDAPSLHKYDARNYRHVDRNFGPDPRGDEARMSGEEPADPSTWVFTAADSLFLVLVDEAHRRGMRVIVDYSWNHTGVTFWAWQDVLEKQAASPYADWYEIQRFDDPATPDTSELTYRGWAGVPDLPELRKVGRPPGETQGAIEGTLAPPVRDHVFAVTRRWLDPDGDGDPADGVDGFRLDVAEMVPLGFWREYRRFVRSINPEAYLVGEVWWKAWPDSMYDPAPWLQGDVFDGVMSYRWYMPTRSFFAAAPPYLTATAYLARLDSVAAGIPEDQVKAMMNLTASHDTPRFATSVYNPGRYKYRVTPRENPDYRVDRPDARTRRIQEMILVQQFTWIGAPHVWNGDEVGMWGADDPDSRKPMLWPDLTYEDEVTGPLGRPRRRDPVAPDTTLRRVYRDLIALRKAHIDLFVDGSVHAVLTADDRRLLVYERVLGEGRALVVFNASDDTATVTLPVEEGRYRAAYPIDETREVTGDSLRLDLAPLSAQVWIRSGREP